MSSIEVVDAVLEELCKTEQQKNLTMLAESRANKNKIIIASFDNYEVLGWIKRLTSEQAYTNIRDSNTVLFKVTEFNAPEGGSNVLFDLSDFDFDRVQILLGEGLAPIPVHCRALVDQNHVCMSLRKWRVLPSFQAKSSSYDDGHKIM